jgi:hypothetical protein
MLERGKPGSANTRQLEIAIGNWKEENQMRKRMVMMVAILLALVCVVFTAVPEDWLQCNRPLRKV